MPKQNHLRIWLVAGFAIETFCITYALQFPDLASYNSLIYFVCGISIAVIILFFPQAKKTSLHFSYSAQDYLKFFLIVATGILLFYFPKAIMHETPIDYRNADMLPVIKKMNQRFLNGEWKHVYDNIPEIWNGSEPIYLPAMWLPFLPAVAVNIDMRWTTIAGLFFASVLPLLFISFKNKYAVIMLVILCMLLWWLLSEPDTNGFISFSEEGVVVLYYVLLVFALISENIIFISIAACLCMLSRYALVGWAPAFFIYLLANKKIKPAVIFACSGMFCLFFLFIVPFGWQPFLRLVHLPGNYIAFAKRVWHDSPEVFTDYIGFAKFFIPDKVNLLHSQLIALSFIVPTAFVLSCNFYKKKHDLNNIPLAALKLSLVIFYNFLDVPYLYLFYTSTFVSLAAVVFFARRENETQLQ